MSVENYRLFMLFKPYGYISQFITNDSKARSKKFLGELYDFPEGTMAIGRLDEKSEGLLLLTTEGKISTLINSRKVEKEYYAQVDGSITSEAIEQLQNEVEIGIEGEKYITRSTKVHKIDSPNLPERGRKIRDDRHGPTSWISITINEGKFRQVRKMTAAVGFATLRLVRVRVGNLKLNGLDVGQVREIESIKAVVESSVKL
ncbi:pseudouridine synthase [Ulvibacter antarcticus]|uniref:Pseudouridine synthase n=1 Tax=Ulvibacter antarcticus TaxID=442714 RepID=A0A3L9YV78_9FLAO|nr:pseudouridine synthase [Ulvibacter antarcticus]RMA64423.1 23S rRNA pseudouridine2457 synthase [Ulvibacter antarcticus]